MQRKKPKKRSVQFGVPEIFHFGASIHTRIHPIFSSSIFQFQKVINTDISGEQTRYRKLGKIAMLSIRFIEGEKNNNRKRKYISHNV